MERGELDVEQVRQEVERLLERYGEETMRAPHLGEPADEGKSVSGVRGRPRLLFCGVVAGAFAHGLLLPDEPAPSPVCSPLLIYLLFRV
jgi:hypothetical protein